MTSLVFVFDIDRGTYNFMVDGGWRGLIHPTFGADLAGCRTGWALSAFVGWIRYVIHHFYNILRTKSKNSSVRMHEFVFDKDRSHIWFYGGWRARRKCPWGAGLSTLRKPRKPNKIDECLSYLFPVYFGWLYTMLQHFGKTSQRLVT